MRAGYAENPVAQRAVKLVMNAVAEGPLEPCDERAAELVGARSGGQPLLATIAAHLLLHGNAYVQVLRDPEGGVVTAGCRFDVPARFAEDTLTVSRATFLAGEAASVQLVEVRED